jgi:A/G-specific adenine glycosylase
MTSTPESPSGKSGTSDRFLSQAVVAWQRRHGRHHLPWQNTQDPYRVWLSEIMLQQTQVVTVMDYFARFLLRFPDVTSLANGSLDEVLGLWAGLGYYSRARNLHACAQAVVRVHGGVFPRTAAQLLTLPGIGPSTAAAIASLCFGARVAILDGNVKRVLTRYLGFADDLALAASERLLWREAELLLPEITEANAMPSYTQGMMDLGATLCTAKKPACPNCPLHTQCVAFKLGKVKRFPVKSRRLKRSSQSIWLLWARSVTGAVWLSQRPTPGVWAGLYCFPLFEDVSALQRALGDSANANVVELPAFKHVLTHKDLHLHPVQVTLSGSDQLLPEGAWFEPRQWPQMGMPAPIKKLLLPSQKA